MSESNGKFYKLFEGFLGYMTLFIIGIFIEHPFDRYNSLSEWIFLYMALILMIWGLFYGFANPLGVFIFNTFAAIIRKTTSLFGHRSA